ncbi:MAG: hypothetical protein HKL84_06210 [Acidimicrobiaceae bacterium]|nr:hypothetical protein [Acidimicrobiaceae bacterium]
MSEITLSEDTADNAKRFEERLKRIEDTIALRETDRVPIMYHAIFWHATYAGITFREAMYNYAKVSSIMKEVVLELQPDAVAAPHRRTLLGPTMELMGYQQMLWPGHGVGVNYSYQHIDHEYMKPEEYNDYIEDPDWFYFTRYLPRVAEAFAPMSQLPRLASAQRLSILGLTTFFTDEMAASFARLADAGREMGQALHSAAAFDAELTALGFPLDQVVSAYAPFDYFADNMRGAKGIMLDLFRRPNQLLAAMNRAIPIIIKAIIERAAETPCKMVFFAIHWGLDGFMSPDQFKTFFWPQLRRVLISLIDAGLVPQVYWEGDCTSRLETIADIPAGRAIYFFERTDLFRAKAILGDVVCVRGNVPASMLNTGTPDDVRDYCRKLIEGVGKNGGFILDGGIGIPDEARLENVKAMFHAVHEFRA